MRAHLALLLPLAITACSTGASNVAPPTASNPAGPGTSNGVLQLAVGVVTSPGGVLGLNVLETFRGANGFTAVPINIATLSGPTGFVGTPGSKDPGSNASTVPLGSLANAFVIGNAGAGSDLASADGFGIGPPSSSNAGMNFYPAQPQFLDASPLAQALFGTTPAPIYGAPPAYPAAPRVPSALSSQLLIPSGWPEGFYMLALNAPPPSGTYTLSVAYAQNGVNSTVNASATLDATQQLAPFLITIASTHDGGATVTLAGPIDPRITHVLANVIDPNVPPAPGATCLAGAGMATVAFTQPGTQTIPPNLGQGGSPTFCSGDTLVVHGFGFDYDDMGLGPPANTSPSPAMPAQADISVTANVGQE